VHQYAYARSTLKWGEDIENGTVAQVKVGKSRAKKKEEGKFVRQKKKQKKMVRQRGRRMDVGGIRVSKKRSGKQNTGYKHYYKRRKENGNGDRKGRGRTRLTIHGNQKEGEIKTQVPGRYEKRGGKEKKTGVRRKREEREGRS